MDMPCRTFNRGDVLFFLSGKSVCEIIMVVFFGGDFNSLPGTDAPCQNEGTMGFSSFIIEYALIPEVSQTSVVVIIFIAIISEFSLRPSRLNEYSSLMV